MQILKKIMMQFPPFHDLMKIEQRLISRLGSPHFPAMLFPHQVYPDNFIWNAEVKVSF